MYKHTHHNNGERCAHKKCRRQKAMKIAAKNKRNTIAKTHLCCGICCPHVLTTNRETTHD